MQITKCNHALPIFDTHKPINITFPDTLTTNFESESKYQDGKLVNGKSFKIHSFHTDNGHFFLVKDICKVINYPSSYQFWKKLDKRYINFSNEHKKLTALSQNEILFEAGLINSKEADQRISYIDIKISYQIFGSLIVAHGDSEDNYYDINNEYDGTLTPEEISKDENVITINEIFPQLTTSSKIITTSLEDRKNYIENSSIILPGQGFLSEVNLNSFLKINNYNKEKSATTINGNINKIVKKLNDTGITASNVSNNLLNKINKLPLVTEKVIKPQHNNKLRYVNGLSKFSPLIKNHIEKLDAEELNLIEIKHNNLQFNKFLSIFRNWRSAQWQNYYLEKLKTPDNEAIKILEFENVIENEFNLEILKTIKIPNGNNLDWSNISKVDNIYD